MEPFVPGTQPLDPDFMRRALRLSIAPQQEKLERERMARAAALAGPHTRIQSGALPAALWGAGDAAGDFFAGMGQRRGRERLEKLYSQQLDDRRGMYDALNTPDPQRPQAPSADPSVPDMLRRPEDPAEAQQREQGYQKSLDASALRRKNAAVAMSMTGDPAMEEAAKRMQAQQQLDREYAQMRQQLEHQNRVTTLAERTQGEAEKQHAFERGHTLRTEQEWVTSPVPDMPGAFTHTSKHTGEAWFIMPGESPVQISKGHSPGEKPGDGGPTGAAAATGGKIPPYSKLNTEQFRTAVGTEAGATGLLDALKEGYPSDNRLRSIGQSLQWKAAEHGMPQLASDANQGRVNAWDAVFDPVARERAGLRIPEEQLQRMRMELRPQPGDSWDNHVSKTKRIITTFRAAASNLPPLKSRPILAELDKIEATLPTTKAAYKAFNKNAEQQMKNLRAGQGKLSAVVPPQAGPAAGPPPPPAASPGAAGAPAPQAGPPQMGPPQAPNPAQQVPLQQRLSSYGWPVQQ